MYGVCIFFIKLSILLQYLEIFMPIKKTDIMYFGPHLLIWTNLILYLVMTILEIWICKPIAKAYDPLITDGRCLNTYALNVATSAFNALSDFAILVLPQVVIWRLQMSAQRKTAASFIFLVGLLYVFKGAIRASS